MRTFKPPFRVSGTNHVVDANGIVLEPVEVMNIINLNDRLIASLRLCLESDVDGMVYSEWLSVMDEAKAVLDDAVHIYQIR